MRKSQNAEMRLYQMSTEVDVIANARLVKSLFPLSDKEVGLIEVEGTQVLYGVIGQAIVIHEVTSGEGIVHAYLQSRFP